MAHWLGRSIALGLGVFLFTAAGGCSSTSNGIAEGDDGGLPSATPNEPTADAATDATRTGSVPGPTACPAAKHATVVVVGDSISDVGGRGPNEEPFYRTLLLRNDDAKWPEWKNFDLATCWELDPKTSVVKVSKNGAIGTLTPGSADGHVLLDQVKSLPATLPGPVLVIGTIGGNDIGSGLVSEITGTPADRQAKIDDFIKGFSEAMTELTRPDRFGAGVKVDVLMTDIYDPSGGTGNFFFEPGKESCPGALGHWPADRETRTPVAKWNNAMKAEAAKHPGVQLLGLRAAFEPHAVATPPETNWYIKDCIHPNAAGHNGIRALFWDAMTKLP